MSRQAMERAEFELVTLVAQGEWPATPVEADSLVEVGRRVVEDLAELAHRAAVLLEARAVTARAVGVRPNRAGSEWLLAAAQLQAARAALLEAQGELEKAAVMPAFVDPELQDVGHQPLTYELGDDRPHVDPNEIV